jgi:hypothetical protein
MARPKSARLRWLLAIALGAVAGALAVGVATRVSNDGPRLATRSAFPTAATTFQAEPLATPDPEVAGTPMDEAGFWRIIDEARAAGGGEADDVSRYLEGHLAKLPPEAILEFARIRHRLDEQAYTWDLWGAAYVIEDGCSEDCFRDFRSYLISLGRASYQAALRDPDSLAGVVEDAENGDWENADNVAPDAYATLTEDDFPLDDSDLSGNPRGVAWDSQGEEALIARYPKLAARFR